ncbi:DUF3888 domain-containing protein [Virgibacillus halodenitrificans]|nr:DUF3888 domain-containing protein [Virgibacillus halodenitrificans]
MKKNLFVIALSVLFLLMSYNSVQAENSHKHDSKGMEQVIDHFLLEQFNNKIHNALKNYYKKDSIHFQFDWWAKDYDVIEMQQSEKGQELSHPYLIKFTVKSYSEDGKQLGTDAITFGVTPVHKNMLKDNNLIPMQVEQLNLEHQKPTNQKK